MNQLPSVESFARADREAMRRFYRNFLQRMQTLEQIVGKVGFDTQTSTPINPAPALARVALSAHPNQNMVLEITNPQFLSSSTPGKIKGNVPRTPLTHKIQYSFDPQFKNGIVSPPPGTQTHYTIPTDGRRVYVKVQSSPDGVNYNTPQLVNGQSK